ncbi:MAG: tetratricopeptide repeat protein [Gemmatimonadota bacterium]
MSTTNVCEQCGGPLLNGSCTACDSLLLYRFIHRELLVLALLSGLAVLVFIGTRAAAAANREMRERNASFWYAQAQEALAAGATAAAVTSFQHASTADRENREYRLGLARALTQNQQVDAARQVLLVLRQSQPEDAAVNTQLARLEVRRSELQSALGYYQSAIYGRWSPQQLTQRRQLRVELIRFLLANGQRARALSELLVLSDELPRDARIQIEAAHLYQGAGDARRALNHFLTALEMEPTNAEALAGAGRTAFELGDYARAISYFDQLREPGIEEQLQRNLAADVLLLDPTLPRLTAQQRQARLQAGLRYVIRRLETCDAESAGMGSLEPQALAARQLGRTITIEAIRRSPDLIEAAVERIAAFVSDLPAKCEPLTIRDRALQHIAARQAAAVQ